MGQTSPAPQTLSQLFVEAGLEAVERRIRQEAFIRDASYLQKLADERNVAVQRALKAEAELRIAIARKAESDNRGDVMSAERNAAEFRLFDLLAKIEQLKSAEKEQELYHVFRNIFKNGGI